MLWEEQRINVVRTPRESIQPGAVVIISASGALEPFPIADMLADNVALPNPERDEHVVNIEASFGKTASKNVEVSIIGELWKIVTSLPASLIPSLRAKYESKGATQVRYRFSKVLRDWISPVAIAHTLNNAKIDLTGISLPTDARIYVVTSVFKCGELELTWEDDQGRLAEGGVDANDFGSLAMKGTRTSNNGAKLTITSEVPHVFGVRVVELLRKPANRLVMLLNDSFVNVLGGTGKKSSQAKAELRIDGLSATDYPLLDVDSDFFLR
jgi:hypothetical protein